jgi:hypothetical protein
MGKQVCNGAMVQCTMGVAPSALNVLPIYRVQAGSAKIKIQQMAALLDSDTCNCLWGGAISIKPAEQTAVDDT